jgi:hypothetical protein
MKPAAFLHLILFSGLSLLVHRSESAPASVVFTDVAQQAGVTPVIVSGSREKNYILEVNGSGACWLDFNKDGYSDLYLVNGATLQQLQGKALPVRPRNYLFRNNGDGTFTDVTAPARVPGKGWGFGCAVADYDNDGNSDLFITNFGPNLLYRNNGDGAFTDVTAAAGLVQADRWHAGAAFGDYDRDGYVDLYVSGYLDFDVGKPPRTGGCPYHGLEVKACGPRGFRGAPDSLYRNNGNGTFTDVTVAAGVEDRERYFGFAVIFDDFDNDGRSDIFVANDSNPNYLYHNRGDGTFREIGVTAGVAYSADGKEHSNMGVAAADYDNNGLMDLFITTFADDNYVLFRNDGNNLFTDVSYPSGVAEPTIPWLGWATFFLDYNNDGQRDLFVVNGHVYPEVDGFRKESYRQPLQILGNLGNGKFREVTADTGLARLPQRSGRGGAFCDYDNDGDIDAVVSNIDDRPMLLRNDGGNRSSWIEFETAGTASNRSGIGARVKVVAGGLVQFDHVRAGGSFLSSNDLRLHFGLAGYKRADVEVRWPNGTSEQFENIEANKIWRLQEGKGISLSVFQSGLKDRPRKLRR